MSPERKAVWQENGLVMSKVAVIGAGAAGLMAAYVAAKNGNEVVVFDKNEKAGKKIYITGKGRCNVTNNTTPEGFLDNVVHGRKFLISSIYAFSPARTIQFLEEGGLPLKTERGNRVFPASDKASDVTKCLERYCKNANVIFRFLEGVTEILCDTSRDFLVRTHKDALHFDKVIVCTGGVSYPATGSTGDGYKFAESCGLRVNPLRPALCGIACDMNGLGELQGLQLKNVHVSALQNGRPIHGFFGEMLFTHFGVSGPIVLSLSSLLNEAPMRDVTLLIDLKPALDETVLDKRLLRDFETRKNKKIVNALDALLPKSIIVPVLVRAGISSETPVNNLTKEQRASLIKTIKAFPLHNCKLRPIEEGIVTAGGVDLKEINPKTMESKKVPGLFFCGEVLDLDALTGGFNLQIAFSTGYAAGNSI